MKQCILLLLTIFPSIVLSVTSESQNLELNSLMDSDLQLSTVTRRLKLSGENAASIYVLSGEEINKSGFTSIPQALTLVPGIQVRKINNNNWAITLRSVAGRYSSRMLVLINGQSIYDSVDGGVNWETLNLPMYDIERIEVIRSQGGLSWGSNATNGVINIITKHSEDTRGITSQVESGQNLNHNASIRAGSVLESLGSYRVHAFSKNLDQSNTNTYSVETGDNNQSHGLGARFDINLSNKAYMLIQGDYQRLNLGNTYIAPDLNTNGSTYTTSEEKRKVYNMMARLDHIIDYDTSQLFQITYSHEQYDSFYFQNKQTEFDADYLISTMFDPFQIDFGLNYRYIDLSLNENDYLTSLSHLNQMQYFSVFSQVQYELIPNELKFIIGNKSERNDAIDWQHQPTLKVIWRADNKNTLWASVSQGARFPSFTEMDLRLLAPGTTLSTFLGETGNPYTDNYIIPMYIQGNSDIQPEISVSQELGYRYKKNRWDLDLSLFKTKSRNVLTTEFDTEGYSIDEILSALYGPSSLEDAVTGTSFIQTFVSEGELNTYGGELIIGWQALPRLKAELGYSYTHMKYDLPSTASSSTGDKSELEQWSLKTIASANDSHTFFTLLRWEKGEAYNTDDFYTLDASWHWQVTPKIQFGITGNNLLISGQVEYNNTTQLFVSPSVVEPSATAKLKIDF